HCACLLRMQASGLPRTAALRPRTKKPPLWAVLDKAGAMPAELVIGVGSGPKVCIWRGSGLAVDHLLQLARFVHLHHDVRATDEFALDVQLGNGGPVAVVLDALANLLVFQYVHRGN